VLHNGKQVSGQHALKLDSSFSPQNRSKSKRKAASIRFFTRHDVYEDASSVLSLK
jgi:hypothetical protein